MFDPTTETKADFEMRYRSSETGAVFGTNRVAMPCTCEDGGGPTHWAAVRNTPEAIDEHLALEKCLADIRKGAGD